MPSPAGADSPAGGGSGGGAIPAPVSGQDPASAGLGPQDEPDAGVLVSNESETGNGCDGILPAALPDGIFWDVPHAAGETCTRVIGAAGSGIAVGLSAAGASVSRWLLSSNGTAIAATEALVTTGDALVGPSPMPWDSGFSLNRWDSSGAVTAQSWATGNPTCTFQVAPESAGSVVLLDQCHAMGGCDRVCSSWSANRFDHARASGSLLLASDDLPGAQAAASGDWLLIGFGSGRAFGMPADAVVAKWVDQGWTSTAPFVAGHCRQPCTDLVLAPFGDGVAVHAGGAWSFVAKDSTVTPMGAWIQDRQSLTPIRDGQAWGAGAEDLGIFTASGASCGRLSVPGAESVTVDRDGTVIARLRGAPCSFVFWPALLR